MQSCDTILCITYSYDTLYFLLIHRLQTWFYTQPDLLPTLENRHFLLLMMAHRMSCHTHEPANYITIYIRHIISKPESRNFLSYFASLLHSYTSNSVVVKPFIHDTCGIVKSKLYINQYPMISLRHHCYKLVQKSCDTQTLHWYSKF